MKIKLFKHIDGPKTPSTRRILVSSVLLLLHFLGFSQKKLTDSLLIEKRKFETYIHSFEKDTNYIEILYELSRGYIYQFPDSTKILSEKTIRLSEQIGFEKGLAMGQLSLGTFYNIKGEFDKATEHLAIAEEKAIMAKADKILLKTINSRAMGQFMKGNYPEAYLECKKGEEVAEKIGDLEMQVFFVMNLGTSFAILRDYEQALPYFERALQIVSLTKDEVQKAQIESNLGYMFLHTNAYEKAKEFCNSAIKTFNKLQSQAWESFAWATLGEVALKEKKYDEALNNYFRSEALLETIGDKQRKAETAQGLAEVYYLKNEFDKSYEQAVKAETIAREINYHQGIVKSSEILYKLLLKKNDLQKALKYLDTAKHLSDSILESENRTKFLLLETQAKFNRQKKLTEFENERKLAKQRTISIAAIILLLAFVFTGLIILNNARNEKKSNLALKELNETKDKLFSIIGHDLKAPIGTLQELLELYGSKEITEEEIIQLAPRLKQNVDHSAFTLNNLLFWAKSQMDGIKANKTTISVKEKATGICEVFDTSIKKKDLEIKCSIDPNLEVLVDPIHLEIILRNVISNAIKFSRSGEAITFSSQTLSNGRVEIQICDSGVGMAESTRKTILNNEALSSSPGTMGEKGTGIGLKIVQDLTKINHGEFKIDSRPGHGTCIMLVFQSV